jgi:hypothetical protein
MIDTSLKVIHKLEGSHPNNIIYNMIVFSTELFDLNIAPMIEFGHVLK